MVIDWGKWNLLISDSHGNSIESVEESNNEYNEPHGLHKLKAEGELTHSDKLKLGILASGHYHKLLEGAPHPCTTGEDVGGQGEGPI
jgi:hypothetical protein